MVERPSGILALLVALVSLASAGFAQTPAPIQSVAPVAASTVAAATMRIEPAAVSVGEQAELVVTLPDGTRTERITLHPAESQASMMMLGEPATKDGTTWRVPVRFLTSEISVLEPIGLGISEGTEAAVPGANAKTMTHAMMTDGAAGGALPGAGEAFALSTEPVAVSVAGPKIAEGDPRDWTAYMAAPFGWARAAKKAVKIAAIVAAVAVPFVLLFMHLRKRKPKADVAAATARTPLEELDSELVELRTLKDFRAHGAEAHYTRLSMALRRYFEGTGQFAAVEMTDDEVLSELRHRLAGTPAAPLLSPIFDAGSLAKFARQAVTERDAHEHLQNATTFIALERDRLRERIAAAGKAA